MDYVLSPFRPEDQEPVEIALLRAAEAAECWMTEGAVAAMNRYNRNVDTESQQE